ncbi:MAG: hypothetical protein ACRDRI_14620 [Pseudonocardiaceae bacterium]
MKRPERIADFGALRGSTALLWCGLVLVVAVSSTFAGAMLGAGLMDRSRSVSRSDYLATRNCSLALAVALSPAQDQTMFVKFGSLRVLHSRQPAGGQQRGRMVTPSDRVSVAVVVGPW